jgi:hypothetical protein
MKYTRIQSGQYLAIINEENMVEIHADSKEEASEIAHKIYKGNISVCRIPAAIGYITKQ